jgi:hypothetical protein
VTACVFLGPTLPVAEAREVLDADYLPPVRQGDVYRAVTRLRPRVIGIVDGYFHQVPSVWHKEILWAMAEGVHVFGSASMGALRAAELEPFGMQGVGAVFAAFRDGDIEDDDEVAVIHGPPEIGYVAASEAMVNIRRTLSDAQVRGVVGAATKEALESIAKSLYYPKRAYPDLLARGAAAGLSGDELSALRTWLEHGRVDQKREDALAMLAALRDLLAENPTPRRVDYRFEHTTMWAASTAVCNASTSGNGDDAERSAQEWLLDELRLDGRAYAELRHAALLRLLARREAERGSLEVPENALRQRATDFRLAHGLHFGRDLDRWLSDRDLDRREWGRMMEDEALVNELGDAAQGDLERYIVNQLRSNGDYEGLAARAHAKRERLLAAGDDSEHDTSSVDGLRALAWYFEHRLGARMPDDMDAYATHIGFADTAAFQRAVVREYRFQQVDEEVRAR